MIDASWNDGIGRRLAYCRMLTTMPGGFGITDSPTSSISALNVDSDDVVGRALLASDEEVEVVGKTESVLDTRR